MFWKSTGKLEKSMVMAENKKKSSTFCVNAES